MTQVVMDTEFAIKYSGAWHPLVDDGGDSVVLARGDAHPVEVTYGVAPESSVADPSTLRLSINNRDGRFSPRNPASDLYGLLGRNTPCRFRAGPRLAANLGLGLYQEDSDDAATTPDASALDITGDIDIAVEFTAFERLDIGTSTLITKGTVSAGGTGSNFSYALLIGTNTAYTPHLTLRWSTNGTTVLAVDHDMTELLQGEHMAVRVTLDVDNGASGRTVTFYTSDSGTVAGPWTQHGAQTVTSGTTSIHSGTGAMAVGLNGTIDGFIGIVHAALVKNGIGGTAVANPTFNTQAEDDDSFADAAGRTWTVGGEARLGYYRATLHVGEASALPVRWDVTGRDVWVPLESSGISRRLIAGKSTPNTDPMTDYLLSSGPAVAWVGRTDLDTTRRWPLLPLGPVNYVVGGAFLGGTDAAWVLVNTAPVRDGDGYLRSGYLNGGFFTYNTVGARMGFTWQADSGAMGNLGVVLESYSDGTSSREYEVQILGSSGLVKLIRRELNYTTMVTTVTEMASVEHPCVVGSGQGYGDGNKHTAYLKLDDSGADVTWVLYIDGDSVASGTINSITLTTAAAVHVAYDPVDGGNCVFGYLGIWVGNVQSAAAYDFAATQYDGELAAVRMLRVCADAGIALTIVGQSADTIAMGPMGSTRLWDVLADCANTDGGMLFDTPNGLGLTYVTRAYLYNRPSTVSLPLTGASPFSAAPEGTDDDYGLRNDVTATDTRGGSAREQELLGGMSVYDPPAGVGRYPASVSVNPYSPGALGDIAGRELARGTLDATRWPSLSFELSRDPVLADASLMCKLMQFGPPMFATLTDWPAFMPQDDVLLLVVGGSHRVGRFMWAVDGNAEPGDVWQVAVYDTARYDSEYSTVNGAHTDSDTTISVTSDGNTELWTTDVGDFPFDVKMGPEVMTVASISGSSSPQTFTVTRAVNGVAYTFAGGEEVHVHPLPRYAQG